MGRHVARVSIPELNFGSTEITSPKCRLKIQSRDWVVWTCKIDVLEGTSARTDYGEIAGLQATVELRRAEFLSLNLFEACTCFHRNYYLQFGMSEHSVSCAKRVPEQISAGVSSKLVVATTIPVVATAVGMHYNSDFRNMIDTSIPGASKALSKITNTDYNPSTGQGDPLAQGRRRNLLSTLPPGYETLPKLLHRIEEENIGRNTKDDDRDSSGPTEPGSPGKHPSVPSRTVYGSIDFAQNSTGTATLSSADVVGSDAESRIAKVFGRQVLGTQLQSDDFDYSVYHRPGQSHRQTRAEDDSKV
jgi:hypothetical protein